MHKITSEREFERVWSESEALICDFSVSWCGPRKMLELTDELSRAKSRE